MVEGSNPSWPANFGVSMKALYRKLNDGSHNSSTYHKKDGTPVRAILKRELEKILAT